MPGNSPLDGRMTEHPMTEATPLASEQITQEDHIREMAEANAERNAFTTDVDVAAAIELAVTVGLTLSASPAPSGQGVSGTLANPSTFGKPTFGLDAAPAPSCAPGEVERLRAVLGWYAEQVADCRKITSAGDQARKLLDADGGVKARAALSPQGLDAKEGECPSSPDGRHQVDTSMESGPNNCFHCEAPLGGN